MASLHFVPQAVVGIDIGTSASGFSFAFFDAPEIITDGNLPKNPRYHKAPTVLLTKANGDFKAFGLDAIVESTQEYRDESDLLFSKFKLALVNATSDPQIRAGNGGEASLLEIMTQTIQFIKEEALVKLTSILGERLSEQRIVWVITVPAIWSEFSKHFMRRAAFQAGLMDTEDSSRLILALEPEAAVASCIHDMNPVLKLPNGTKFIMLDCGGGTIDITSHVIASGGVNDNVESCNEPLCLNELVAPRGGDWGSMRVDENFLNQILKPLLGPTLFQKFQTCHECKHQLLEDFEIKIKKTHNPEKTKGMRLNISVLDEVFEGEDLSMKDLIDEYNSKQQDPLFRLELLGGSNIKLSYALICSLFDPLLDNIIHMLTDLIELPQLQGLSQVFLVGGFGESLYLQDRVKKTLMPRGVNISVAPCPGKSVMLGAVRFGLSPRLFASRVSRFSYGVLAVIDGKSDVFDKFVSCAEQVPCGHQVERVYRPVNASQSWISVEIVRSADPNINNNQNVYSLANLRIEVPMDIPYLQRKIKVSMSFGSTEISAVASLVGGGSVKSDISFNTNVNSSSSCSSASSKHVSVHFLIDVSTSMNDRSSSSSTKLDDAKEGIQHVISQVLVKDSIHNHMALSIFSNSFESKFTEQALNSAPTSLVQQLKVISGTRFYLGCVEQLELMEQLYLSGGNDLNRVLLVFTDGEDNSSSNYETNAHFIKLSEMLAEKDGICSKLAGFYVIAVGLREQGLVPLRKLSAMGNLELLPFEEVTDIEKAFAQATEKIEKVLF